MTNCTFRAKTVEGTTPKNFSGAKRRIGAPLLSNSFWRHFIQGSGRVSDKPIQSILRTTHTGQFADLSDPEHLKPHSEQFSNPKFRSNFG